MAAARPNAWFIDEDAGWSGEIEEARSTGILTLPFRWNVEGKISEVVSNNFIRIEPLDSFLIGYVGDGGISLSGIGYLLPSLTLDSDEAQQEFLVGVLTQRFDLLPVDAFPRADNDEFQTTPLVGLTSEQIESINRTLMEYGQLERPVPENILDRKGDFTTAREVVSARFGSEVFEKWRSTRELDHLLIHDDEAEQEPPEERRVWVCQYLPGDYVERWIPTANAGGEIPWKADKDPLPNNAKSGDLLIYWRGIKDDFDRGGLIGTGILVDPSLAPDDMGVNRFRTRVTEIFSEDPIDRDSFIDKVGLWRSWPGAGSFKPISPENFRAINEQLSANGRKTLPVEPEPDPVLRPGSEPEPAVAQMTELISDAPASDHDYLNRSALAFMVAAHLNRVWAAANGSEGWTSRIMNGLKFWRWFSKSAGPSSKLEDAVFGRPAFVIHVDAPWGGGKSTFANYLARILNRRKFNDGEPGWLSKLPMNDPLSWPLEYRRPWHIVFFNAWQHQHLDPPWWSFYQAIRRQCFGDLFWGRVGTVRSIPASVRRILDTFQFVIWRAPKWTVLWTLELRWRIFNPKVGILLTTFLVSLALAALVVAYQPDPNPTDGRTANGESSEPQSETGSALVSDTSLESQADQPQGAPESSDEGTQNTVVRHMQELAAELRGWLAKTFGVDWQKNLATALLLALSGGAGIWSVVSLFTESLLPGTTPAAKNYSLGSGDPLERFRRHFDRMMKRLGRPILVVVDDIDRCRPEVVVELVRGMQTVLRSPRVVFLVLGDLDWISKAFETQHEMMKEIEVGEEHTFGGRFVEKAFQMSLVLPSMEEDTQREFVGRILGTAEAENAEVVREYSGRYDESSGVDDHVERERKFQLEQKAVQTALAKDNVDADTQRRILSQRNLRAALRNAGDKQSKVVTQHRLAGIARVLPPNPRQIKRIVNGITLYQEVGRIHSDIQPETDEWRKLALWIVLMTEWPTTWNRLGVYPGLVDQARSGNSDGVDSHLLPMDSEIASRLAKEIRQDRAVWEVLAFSGKEPRDWPTTNIASSDILKMRKFVPPNGSAEIPAAVEAK